MRRTRRIAGNGRAAGIGAPIAWSAAGHLFALLAVLFAVSGAPAFSLPGVVEVLLVPGPRGSLYPGPAPPSQRRGPASGKAVKGGSVEREVRSTPIPRPVVPERIPEARVAAPDAGEEREGSPSPGGRGGGGPAPPGEHAAGDPGLPPEGDGLGAAGDSGTAAGLRLALLRFRIQERIVYPAEAVRRGQEGEVLLRIRIGSGGVPREIRVAKSSGSRILDEAARVGVVRAAPLPSDPGWFEIPVRFSLR